MAVNRESDASRSEVSSWNPWEDARSRGIEFRALGNEPGWFLEVDNERWMRLFYANAERMVSVPVPAAVRPGEAAMLTSDADGHSVRVEIVVRECSDTMSDERFPATVTVTLDGMLLHGCGRWLAP